MNLVIKSSVLTVLAAAVSSVSANICIDTGNNAAELVILENWCEPNFFSKTSSLDPEERCRAVAIRTCQSGTTLRDIINDWCPETRPSNTDIFNLGDYCEDTVDGLIGLRGRGEDEEYSEVNVSSFVSKASKIRKPTRSPTRRPTPDSSVVSGFRAGQQAMQQWWEDGGSTCSNAWSGIINPAANEIKNSQFPNKGSSNTRARNQSAQLGVDSEVRAIQEECFSANDMDMEAY